MNRWEWTRIGTAVGGAIAVVLVGSWAGSLAVPSIYPARQGYEVPGLAEPPIDLAALQRSWPAGLGEPGGPVRLVAYMSRIEKAAVPVAAPSAVEASKPQVDLGTLLAHADVAKGKQKAQVCMSCHTFEPSGPDRIGPNLWGVVGRDIGSHPGFAYSPAVSSAPGNWTYENLDRWLASPARDIPGTKMAFAGVRQPEERANLLAYLGTLSNAPVPFPKPQAANPSR
jgi:cytochrome c